MRREKRRERDTGPATSNEPSATDEPAPAAGETSTPEEPTPAEPREVEAPAPGDALDALSDRDAAALEHAMDQVDERQGEGEGEPSEPEGDGEWSNEWDEENRDSLFGLLNLVEHDVRKVTRDEISGWTEEQCALAAGYAGALLDRASDHEDVEIPPLPDFLCRRRFWTTWNEEHRIGCGVAFHHEAQARAAEDDRRLHIKPYKRGVIERDVVPVDGPEDLVRYACVLPPGESFGS